MMIEAAKRMRESGNQAGIARTTRAGYDESKCGKLMIYQVRGIDNVFVSLSPRPQRGDSQQA